MTVFSLLLDLAVLGFLAYVWVRVVRGREIYTKAGCMMQLRLGLLVAILLFTTGFFSVALVLGIYSLFQ